MHSLVHAFKSRFNRRYNEKLILLFIILLGSFLRLYKLDFQSLENDEIASWNISFNSGSVQEVIQKQAEYDVNPPGYQVILFYVIHYIGDTEFWLRLPSAAAGILSILMIYLLGNKLYSSKEGLISAALTAVLWCPVYYSQEARVYSILFLFSIITTYFWIDLLEQDQPRIITEAFYIISSVITISLHYFGLLFISLQAIAAFVYALMLKKNLKNFIISYGVILIIFLPMVPPLLVDFNPSFQTHIRPVNLTKIATLLHFYFNLSNWFAALAVILYIGLFINIVFQRKKNKNHQTWIHDNGKTLFIFLWLTLPFSVSYLISIFFLPVLTARNLIISLPAAYLLFSLSITKLPLNSKVKTLFTLVVLSLFIFHLLVNKGYYSKPTKPEFRRTMEYLVTNEKKEAEPLIIGFAWSKKPFEYYLRKLNSDFYIASNLGNRSDTDSLENLIDFNYADSFWYVYGHRHPDPEFLEFLNNNYLLQRKQIYNGAGIMFFKINEN